MPESNSQVSVGNRILDVCFTAFNQNGYNAVSMDYVARTLRISKKTIYKNFASKEEILQQGIRNELDRFEQSIRSSFPLPAKKEYLLGFALLYRKYKDRFSPQLLADIREELPHLQAWIDLFLKNILKKRFSKVLKDLRSQDRIAYEVSTRDLTESYFGMLNGLFALNNDHTEMMVGLFYRGIRKRSADRVKRKKK